MGMAEAETLFDLRAGEDCVVTGVLGEGAVRRRLFDMGITPGAELVIIKTAPFGDPLEIRVRGYQLGIRKAEAKKILVRRKNGSKTAV